VLEGVHANDTQGPALVLKDADLKKAAELCAFGAFLHHGQICFSTERIIVEKPVANDFIALLQAEVHEKYNKPVGQSATQSSAQRAKDMLDNAHRNGATFLAGDNSFAPGIKASIMPTIIGDIKESDQMFDEETFGPSASLYVVNDVEEAVELANRSRYGLNAAIHTRDVYTALNIARNLDYGQVHNNSPTTYDQDTRPVTGTKASGWGSNNGQYGIGEFLVNKSVTLCGAEDAGISFGS
jgi:acyl-CoA reductase-like NAD-dependent aldehyde dehydrogenase